MDAQHVQAIQEDKDNIRDFIRGKQLRVNAEQKKRELVVLNEEVQKRSNFIFMHRFRLYEPNHGFICPQNSFILLFTELK